MSKNISQAPSKQCIQRVMVTDGEIEKKGIKAHQKTHHYPSKRIKQFVIRYIFLWLKKT